MNGGLRLNAPSCGNPIVPKESVVRPRDYDPIPLIRPITGSGIWLNCNRIVFKRLMSAEKTAFSTHTPIPEERN